MALPVVGVFALDDGLQEAQILDVAAMRLDAVDKVLHHPLRDLVTQLNVVLEDGARRLGLQQLQKKKRESNYDVT